MISNSSLIQISHAVWRNYCAEGDIVVDATMGSGKDTVFLASLIGPKGLVIAVDKQEDAVKKTASLLDVMDYSSRAKLICKDHGSLDEILTANLTLTQLSMGISCAVFNLGYQPGGGKQFATKDQSTIAALNAVWPNIRHGGLLSVHVYSGHEGSIEEVEAVANWMKVMDWSDAQISACSQFNKRQNVETAYFAVKKLR